MVGVRPHQSDCILSTRTSLTGRIANCWHYAWMEARAQVQLSPVLICLKAKLFWKRNGSDFVYRARWYNFLIVVLIKNLTTPAILFKMSKDGDNG